ncbi:MAG: cupin domain-containing protein [Thermoanaerobaculia bacterium]|nr:cupin domain-containing protein [Thermoanaerobaculia bacterium]
MSRDPKPAAYLLRRGELGGLPLDRFVHQHNAEAIRHTACLTDGLGFEDMGVHLVHLKPGDLSSEHHFHEEDEEFVYLLSGRATAFIGDESFEVEAGDFMAFPKHSPPHHMHNPHDEDLVYLVGGTRAPIDVCNYPRRGLRQFRVHGRREFARVEDLKQVR